VLLAAALGPDGRIVTPRSVVKLPWTSSIHRKSVIYVWFALFGVIDLAIEAVHIPMPAG
jgi:hypothetical protein